MPELTPQERLQPALLDRLTDDEPDKTAGAARTARDVQARGCGRPCSATSPGCSMRPASSRRRSELAHAARAPLRGQFRPAGPVRTSRPRRSTSPTSSAPSGRRSSTSSRASCRRRSQVKALVHAEPARPPQRDRRRDSRPALGAAGAARTAACAPRSISRPARSRSPTSRRRGSRLMDPRLLRVLQPRAAALREMGAEFAQQFPKIAARLGMNGLGGRRSLRRAAARGRRRSWRRACS